MSSAHRHRALIAVGGAAIVVGALTAYYLSPTQRAFRAAGDVGQRIGTAFGAGAATVLDIASELREPYRCGFVEPLDDVAAAPATPMTTDAGTRQLTRRGWRLEISAPSPARGRQRPGLVLGVVADTHGDASALPDVRNAFERAGVELVVSLGGHGRSASEIAPVLAALASGRWPLLAMPGGTEALPEHRSAMTTARAHAAGPIIDGSAIRLLVMDGTAIATAPGAASAYQLEAGTEGCVPAPTSIETIARALADHPGAKVVASYTPPTAPTSGSNLTLGGIEVGDATVADLAERGQAALVVHGLVAEAAPTTRGRAAATAESPLVLAAGEASGLPTRLVDGTLARGAALVVTVSDGAVSYLPVRSSASP